MVAVGRVDMLPRISFYFISAEKFRSVENGQSLERKQKK
jgi:hypothetical protein